jgi:ribose/xylose/arabinose/galactoside ABC-type transport system permease subunit
MLNVPPFVQMICSGLVIVLAVGVNMRKSKEIVK